MMMMIIIIIIIIIIISSIWQHVSTSKGHLQDNSMKYIEGTFVFCIINHWPEDGPLI